MTVPSAGAFAIADAGLECQNATKRGFALTPRRAREVVVLARPSEEEHASVHAFLADGFAQVVASICPPTKPRLVRVSD